MPLLAHGSGLNFADVAIVLGGVALMLGVGLASGRVERNTRDFFLGARSLPAWAVCLSFVATEVSAVTIISVPAESYRANWFYLQMFVGSAAARIIIAFLFIPVFFRFECTTIYEYLRHRFGPATHYCATVLFFVTRLLASGVRLYVAAMATAIILGWSAGSVSQSLSGLANESAMPAGSRGGLAVAIVVFTAVAIAFIAFGGIKAIVWTNVLQAIVFILGGAATAGFLLHRIDGGIGAVMQTAAGGGRLGLFNPTLDPSDPKGLALMVFNGFFTSLAVFGTDQDLMQRLLTVDTRRASQRSLLATIVVALPVTALFLSIGTLLFCFYAQNPQARPAGNDDDVLSQFIAGVMPHGLRGLLLLTILMASIDSPLGSLATSFVTDIYRPLIRPSASESHYLAVSRWSVAGFGVVLGLLAFAASYLSGILWVAFQVISVTGGSLLGVFLLGMLTTRRGDRGNVAGMAASAIAMSMLLVLIRSGTLALGWTWLIVLGTGMTFAICYALGNNRRAPGFPVEFVPTSRP